MPTPFHNSTEFLTAQPKLDLLNWERGFGLRWFESNWHWSIYISIAYLSIIFPLKAWMQTREAYSLRYILIVWNALFSTFSLWGAYYVLTDRLALLANNGVESSICVAATDYKVMYWSALFAYSKIAELGDTMFIILRKQKLIFLHWSHHVSAFVYTWYSIAENMSVGYWFIGMNFAVHALMYGYYAIAALKLVKIPRSVAMAITSIQIFQMVLGYYFSYFAFKRKITGQYCELTTPTAVWGFFLYTALFLLFANFFIKTYFFKTTRSVANGKPANGFNKVGSTVNGNSLSAKNGYSNSTPNINGKKFE